MKRSPNKTTYLLTAILSASFGSCTAKPGHDAAEATQVEDALERIERSGPEDRAVLLDDLSRKDIASESLAQMRDSCVAAYEAFFEAKREMQKAKEMTASLELAITRQNAAAEGSEEMLAKAGAAAGALDASDKALARADALLESCTAKRQAIKQK